MKNRREKRRRAKQRTATQSPPGQNAAADSASTTVDKTAAAEVTANTTLDKTAAKFAITAERAALYATCAVFAAFAYLSLVHLDWALLWDDEATPAYLARNWLQFGAPLVDDGRNVFSFRGGADIAADGTFAYPQLLIAMQAAVFAVFGAGEIQARAVSALFSLGAMVLFALILRREFPGRPGFCALVLALAFFAPFTLGNARAATYNSPILFFHLLLFWSYLQFCARKKIMHAAAAVAAALAGFHMHYLSSLVFTAALVIFHTAFRRAHFDRRAWTIAAAGAAVYAAQALWYYLAEFSLAAYGDRAGALTAGVLLNFFGKNLWELNRNDILAWSVALWGLLWCGAFYLRARGKTAAAKTAPIAPQHAPLQPLVLQYLALLFIGTLLLALGSFRVSLGPDIRYFSAFAPFAAIVAAALVYWAWNLARPAGVVIGAALLLTDVAGWPFLKSDEHAGKPSWTLPSLIAEYHRDYPDSLRESLDYIRAHTRQDTLMYSDYRNRGWMFWYLGDRVLFCCALSRTVEQAAAVDAAGREYLFRQDVMRDSAGAFTPEFLFMVDMPHVRDALVLYEGGPVYRRIPDFPGAIVGTGPLVRPEPAWHASRPDLMRLRPELMQWPAVKVMQLYRREAR